LALFMGGGSGSIDINTVTTTWAPTALLPASAPALPVTPGPESGL
jgi:hypothetical protein